MDKGERDSFTSYTGPSTILIWTRVTGPVVWTRVTGPVSQAMLDEAL